MQTKLIPIRLIFVSLIGCLVACNSMKKSSSATVNTETVMEHPNPPPPALLSSQNGPYGSQVDLLKAQVTGNILTVELQYKPGSEDKRPSRSDTVRRMVPAGSVSSTYEIGQVVVIDEATAKTYNVLKDESGNYMASPLRTDQGKQLVAIDMSSMNDKPVAAWFKFPAPPVDTKTIAITIPEVGTYKEIPISR